MTIVAPERSCVRNSASDLRSPSALVEGTYQPNPKGFGFVVAADGGPDVFVPPMKHAFALPGDRVCVKIGAVDGRGRRSGRVVSIGSAEMPVVMGRLIREGSVWHLQPFDPLWPKMMLKDQHPGPADALALCRMTARATASSPPQAAVLSIWGKRWTVESALAASSCRHGWPVEFPAAVHKETASIPETVQAGADRVDLRSLPFVTIDGASSRDFDDAVHAQRLPEGGFRLWVAIADVAHYVRPGSALDVTARERATSVYVPGAAIPMLPEVLSNGLCSLNPGVDRLCLVCEMLVAEDGSLGRAWFYEAIMRSHARLTYEEVAEVLGGSGSSLPPAIVGVLAPLDALYRSFAAARAGRGALDFESPEVRFRFDTQGCAIAIDALERNDAHRLIEECMIAANVQAARWLIAHEEPGPFRIHGVPDVRRYADAQAYLGAKGIRLPDRDTLTTAALSRVLAQSVGRSDLAGISAAISRAQAKAVYHHDNRGHFGLGLEAYAHFTSPIRRYPDVLVHRAIKRCLRQEKPATLAEIQVLVLACSAKERTATAMERETVDRHRCAYLSRHLGQKKWNGTVNGIMSFGAFVVLDGSLASGLLPIAALPGTGYRHDAAVQALVGDRVALTVGDRVQVKVIDACPDTLRINLAWVGWGD